MARINERSLKVLIAKDSTGKLKAAAEQRATEVFNDAVLVMQDEFASHPVTREIEAGINAANQSGTLGGRERAPKNLFSFIGFPQDSKPLEPIYDALNPDSKTGKNIGPRLNRSPIKDVASNGALRYTFKVAAPDKQAIYKSTPMPWAGGLSWAQKIETKIPGLANFLAKFMPNASDEVSRSKGGTQLQQEVRKGAEYIPPENGYLTTIFSNFLKRIQQYHRGGLKRKF